MALQPMLAAVATVSLRLISTLSSSISLQVSVTESPSPPSLMEVSRYGVYNGLYLVFPSQPITIPGPSEALPFFESLYVVLELQAM